MPTETKPTIGRNVWYWPDPAERSYTDTPAQPFHANVAHVNEDGTVNLAVANDLGYHMHKINVTFEPDPSKAVANQASWMPYQRNQEKGDRPAPAPAAADFDNLGTGEAPSV